ncbi:MAG: bifunctional oligoribonuclease/PAP phosphatase NrnA [Bacteroidales bacterium]|nr:bifunctional oligoribonuclease/PAP phosphatase NrnA [Bacteroidales bacterium]
MLSAENSKCFAELSSSHESAVKELLDTARKVVIFTHKNPDGDALGSALGLSQVLSAMGHQVNIVIPDSAPGFLRWLPGYKDVVIFENTPDKAKMIAASCDLVFCLDFSYPDRVGAAEDLLKTLTVPIILIDHHPQQKIFATYNFVLTSRGSTAELLYCFLDHFRLQDMLNEHSATCLLAGMITDTLGFKVNSSYPEVFEVVMNLMALGADKDRVFEEIYNQYSADRMRLLAFSISSRMKIYEESEAACIYLSQADLLQFNNRKGDTEGFVNYPLSIKGVNFSVLFTEQKDHVKLSLRSKGDIFANKFAEKYFQGGGHKNAAGGKYYGSLNETITYFEELLNSDRRLDDSLFLKPDD